MTGPVFKTTFVQYFDLSVDIFVIVQKLNLNFLSSSYLPWKNSNIDKTSG